MILHHLSQVMLSLKFESDDWNTGIARQAIDLIKTFPKGSKTYNPQKKMWMINKMKAEKHNMEHLYQLQEKALEVESLMEEDDFDAEKWLDETFGPRKVII